MRKTVSFRRQSARWVLLGVALATLGSSRVAHAEGARSAQIQEVVFEDDLLDADLGAPFGVQVFSGHLPPARTSLIRPRTNFVAELYESVERL